MGELCVRRRSLQTPPRLSGLRRCRASRFLGRAFPSGLAAFGSAFVGRQFAAAVWAGLHWRMTLILAV